MRRGACDGAPRDILLFLAEIRITDVSCRNFPKTAGNSPKRKKLAMDTFDTFFCGVLTGAVALGVVSYIATSPDGKIPCVADDEADGLAKRINIRRNGMLETFVMQEE